MSNTRNRVRIACDLAYPYRAPTNTRTTKSPEFPKSKTTRVDIAVYDNGIFQSSISQFTSVTLELIANSNRTGARLVSKTVNAADFASGISASGWTSGSQEHVIFEITAADASAFSVDATTQQQALWLVITATSSDGNVTLVAGPATAVEDGGVYSGASGPAAGDPQYLTADQTYAAITAAAESKRLLSKDGAYEVILDVIDGEVVFHARAI